MEVFAHSYQRRRMWPLAEDAAVPNKPVGLINRAGESQASPSIRRSESKLYLVADTLPIGRFS